MSATHTHVHIHTHVHTPLFTGRALTVALPYMRYGQAGWHTQPTALLEALKLLQPQGVSDLAAAVRTALDTAGQYRIVTGIDNYGNVRRTQTHMHIHTHVNCTQPVSLSTYTHTHTHTHSLSFSHCVTLGV
jgi:hypothetical protein